MELEYKNLTTAQKRILYQLSTDGQSKRFNSTPDLHELERYGYIKLIAAIKKRGSYRITWAGQGLFAQRNQKPQVQPNDAIIPPKQAEAQPPAAAPEVIDLSGLATHEEMQATLEAKREELRRDYPLVYANNFPSEEQAIMATTPDTRDFTEAEYIYRDAVMMRENAELRAEIEKLQVDVVTLTADNRWLRSTLGWCRTRASWGLGEWLGVDEVYVPEALHQFLAIQNRIDDVLDREVNS